ncbi:DUF4342 domain-containing protein [Clostridium oryzae]|uniref:Nascent polypeptide-associated complex protein n=1 Tax=Clostridium oryzae TaxID=1450648 RepID=A0A1V4IHQ1_9CLOT|nr:DUF4342 domain-containing protein [Clostridium oryzae]OPJ59456.1 nascent polypeptide-associated complex protein [Clostridium oryzae]
MSEITVEKVDMVKDRTGVTYTEAKEALETTQGDVVEALVLIESKNKDKKYSTKDEFTNWIKDIINKGNVTRIKIRKDEQTLVDIPVNAGLATTGLTMILSPVLLALGVVTAVVSKVTVEITKEDGTVEVVNKYIKDTFGDVKEKVSSFSGKFSDIAGEVKGKISDITDDLKDKFKKADEKGSDDETVYKYTVKFEEVEDEPKEQKDNENPKEESDK